MSDKVYVKKMRLAWGAKLTNELIEDDHRWLIFEGGRASGKTTTSCIIALMLGLRERIRVLCAREYQSSLRESSMQAMLALSDNYRLGYQRRQGGLEGVNGTKIMFRGLSDSTGTARSIRSLEDIDLVLIDEGQYLKESSLRSLVPTIRKQGFRFIACYNPRFAEDPIWKLARSGGDNVRVVKKNYNENLQLSKDAKAAIEDFRKLYPSSFANEYLGELMDADDVSRVLQPISLEASRNVYQKTNAEGGHVHAGWDVADAGADRNAFAIRIGPRLAHVETWESKRPRTIADSAKRVIKLCEEHDVEHLYFDAGGVGAGAVALLAELAPHLPSTGIHAQGRIGGPETPFDAHTRNRGRFANRYAQMAWTLRMRSDNSRRMSNGEEVEAAKCLSIHPSVGKAEDAAFFDRQMIQPTFSEPSGKVKVEKAPGGTPSPDLFDAVALAFAADSARGLTAKLESYDPVSDYRARTDAWIKEMGG